jgi:hypothetical protein
MSEAIPYEKLEVGTKYNILVDDCCVKADFVATLKEIKSTEDMFEEWELDIGAVENTGSSCVEWYEAT